MCADAVNDQRAKQEQQPVLQVAELAGAAYFCRLVSHVVEPYSAATEPPAASMAARAPLVAPTPRRFTFSRCCPKEPLSQPMHRPRPDRPALSDRRSISSIGKCEFGQANLDVAGTRQDTKPRFGRRRCRASDRPRNRSCGNRRHATSDPCGRDHRSCQATADAASDALGGGLGAGGRLDGIQSHLRTPTSAGTKPC